MLQLMDEEKYNFPEIEVFQDSMDLQIDIVYAIRIIQKNDRGRQGRQRIMLIL
jgi:phage anti-repressor protein